MTISLLQGVLGACQALVLPALAFGLHMPPEERGPVDAQQLVSIAERTLDFPATGEFLAAGGHPVAAPVRSATTPAFHIMKRQVSLAEYAQCVDAGACAAADAPTADTDVPVTGVSWIDANAYARWYSSTTGETWRLPTALEAAAAAAERFRGEAFPAVADDPANPAVLWIRRYQEDAAARRPVDRAPRPGGHYGVNTLGIEDFGGNVWEWTATCYSRAVLDAGGEIDSVIENCGVRVLEGRHRAYMSHFVRDGRSGGCAVGTPPANLGFRLVLDEQRCGPRCWIARFSRQVRA